ncbi:hypothetical protein [Pseudaminobacter soli (ex Li et al. 2025)]|uniref:hypothetical protein n=1 Tax=Pseudaminobacter soli (ex Li et al. 2025) TaxID=1295366 RepID=UPI0011B1E558|nr:hypothetical protein [Mesorhizobium soli]
MGWRTDQVSEEAQRGFPTLTEVPGPFLAGAIATAFTLWPLLMASIKSRLRGFSRDPTTTDYSERPLPTALWTFAIKTRNPNSGHWSAQTNVYGAGRNIYVK